MVKQYETPANLLGQEGVKLGPTDWVEIKQDRVNMFADATDDHQWIHVDEAKAKDGPFGGTIAHGYLTLSLANKFLPQLIEVKQMSMGVNYGVGMARFPNAVKVGARIRATGEFISVEEMKGGIQSTLRITIEIDGEERPACVVDTISRYYP